MAATPHPLFHHFYPKTSWTGWVIHDVENLKQDVYNMPLNPYAVEPIVVSLEDTKLYADEHISEADPVAQNLHLSLRTKAHQMEHFCNDIFNRSIFQVCTIQTYTFYICSISLMSVINSNINIYVCPFLYHRTHVMLKTACLGQCWIKWMCPATTTINI
jgi:hypothetical protein